MYTYSSIYAATFLGASFVIAGCGASSSGADLGSDESELSAPPAQPGPVIPLGTTLGQAATDGPAVVAIEWLEGGDVATDGHSIDIDYVGKLDCHGPGENTQVGVVQNGKTVARAPIANSGRGGCAGAVSIDGLESGPIQLYFFDAYGRFDSNDGANYGFVLDKSVIPGRGPDGPIIPLRTGHPSVAHVGPASASIVGREIDLYYHDGSLPFCATASIRVGVVQNGAQIATAPVSPVQVLPGPFGVACHALVPTGGLTTGKIGFYFFDDRGNVDSAYGANFNFDIDVSLFGT